jgi:hypothetical protein
LLSHEAQASNDGGDVHRRRLDDALGDDERSGRDRFTDKVGRVTTDAMRPEDGGDLRAREFLGFAGRRRGIEQGPEPWCVVHAIKSQKLRKIAPQLVAEAVPERDLLLDEILVQSRELSQLNAQRLAHLHPAECRSVGSQ